MRRASSAEDLRVESGRQPRQPSPQSRRGAAACCAVRAGRALHRKAGAAPPGSARGKRAGAAPRRRFPPLDSPILGTPPLRNPQRGKPALTRPHALAALARLSRPGAGGPAPNHGPRFALWAARASGTPDTGHAAKAAAARAHCMPARRQMRPSLRRQGGSSQLEVHPTPSNTKTKRMSPADLASTGIFPRACFAKAAKKRWKAVLAQKPRVLARPTAAMRKAPIRKVWGGVTSTPNTGDSSMATRGRTA